jgi:endonuclease III
MPPTAPTALARQLDALEAQHGPSVTPPPRGVLDWILWENAAYLVPAEQRTSCFRALKKLAGSDAAGIERVPRAKLGELAQRGGMMPEGRVEKWLEIARVVRTELDGDPEQVLAWPIVRARKALKRFPGIGDPAAEKILLFAGVLRLLAPESNALRVMTRLGYVRAAKSYSTTYRALHAALEPLRRDARWWQRAHVLLQRHGKETCKNTAPRCDDCALSAGCPSAE